MQLTSLLKAVPHSQYFPPVWTHTGVVSTPISGKESSPLSSCSPIGMLDKVDELLQLATILKYDRTPVAVWRSGRRPTQTQHYATSSTSPAMDRQ